MLHVVRERQDRSERRLPDIWLDKWNCLLLTDLCRNDRSVHILYVIGELTDVIN